MKVSIITVSYNAAKTIEQTILSIKAQSYTNIEYIIIDGQSTDGTLDIIEKYKKDIDCIVSEPDKGIYDAMNKGIQYATGDIIGFVNSDDWYEPDTIEKVVVCFNNTDAEITHGLVWDIDGDGNKKKTNGFENEEVEYEQLHYNMLPHLSVFAKRTVFEQYGGFNINYRIAADYDWILRCYTGGIRFQYINGVMGSFRRGGVSTNIINLNELAEENKEISLKYVHHCKNREMILHQIEKKYKASMFIFWEKTNPVRIADSLKEVLLDIVKGVVIFGTGIWGERMYKILNSGNIPIYSFVDNNEKKWGSELHDIIIQSPESLRDYSGYVIIAVRNYADEICAQLTQMENAGMQWFDLTEIEATCFLRYL